MFDCCKADLETAYQSIDKGELFDAQVELATLVACHREAAMCPCATLCGKALQSLRAELKAVSRVTPDG